MKLITLLLLFALAGAASATWCRGEGKCIDRKHVCFGRRKYKCPDDCTCSGKWPCKMVMPRPLSCKHLPNYHCLDDTHFCLAHKKMRCAHGTFCSTTGTRRITPCWRTSPAPRSCPHHMMCTSSKHYCHHGRKMRCPKGWMCFGFGPCVKAI